MEQQDPSIPIVSRPGLAGSYMGLFLSVLVGAALGLGIYFFLTSKNQAASPSIGTADRLCVCPSCGMTINKPNALDCEEVNCPNCAHTMNNAARLAAAAGNPGGAVGTGTMTQNRRETLAEQGVRTPGPMTQNQRETLAEQRIVMPPRPPAAAAQQPVAFAFPPLREESRCVCPNCGKTVDRQPGMSCSHVQCPNCRSLMTNSIPIGRQQDMRLVAMGGGAGAGGGGAAPCPGAGGGGGHGGGGGGAAICPQQGPTANAPRVGTQPVTYSNTIQGIIHRNCLRCHGGPIRTMNTYGQTKAYADNGLLRMMTQPGGPMSRFLSAHESHQVSAWIKAGSPP